MSSHPEPSSPQLCGADFRFLQAFVQGIDVRDAWERYMPHRGSTDLRRIRSTVRMLLDVLAATAKRHGDSATATLLKRDAQRIRSELAPAAGLGLSGSAPAGSRSEPARTASALGPAALQAAAAFKPPTLDEFAQTLEDPDFYSQAELADLWEQQYGKVSTGTPDAKTGTQRLRDTPENRAAKRRARLVLRQVDALRRLESLVAATPQPQDPLAAWLDAQSVKRLGSVGVKTLQDFTGFVNRHGFTFHRKVPRIGKEGASRLVQWLRHHEATLGRLDAFALAPLRTLDAADLTPKASTGVVPFERFLIPSALSGFNGLNRKPVSRCKIAAVNDYQAVALWLDLYRPQTDAESGLTTGNAHTFTAYRKEAERFLLWSVLERAKALSSLDAIDCAAYRSFVQSPPAHWIAPKGMQRWSPHWRPFEGPLGPRSRAYAETVCKMLCRWLVGRNYLDSDPWDGAPKGGKKTPLRELRALSDEQALALTSWLDALPATLVNSRLQLLFELGLTTGLRKEELAHARVGNLGRLHEGQGTQGEGAWVLQFFGKGGKERQVPLLQRTVERLFEHLAFAGSFTGSVGSSLHNGGAQVDGAGARVKGEGADADDMADAWLDWVEGNPDVPLLARLADPLKPLPPARIYELVKDALAACAKDVEVDRPRVAKQLKKASTHWLRHTLGRVWADRGGDLRVLGEILGHSNPATTAIYSRADEKRRRRELEKVFA